MENNNETGSSNVDLMYIKPPLTAPLITGYILRLD